MSPERHALVILHRLLCQLAAEDGPSGYWADVLDLFRQTHPTFTHETMK